MADPPIWALWPRAYGGEDNSAATEVGCRREQGNAKLECQRGSLEGVVVGGKREGKGGWPRKEYG